MFGTSFKTTRRYPTDLRRIGKALGRSVNGTISAVTTSVFDQFSATATDVFRFRMFYSGHIAAFHLSLVSLGKTSCDELPSNFGRMSGSGQRGRKFLSHIFCDWGH